MKREMHRILYCVLLASVLFLVAPGLAQVTDVKVYAFNAGILKIQTQLMLKDTRVGTPMNIPVPFLVIKHGKEWIAFDTGCSANAAKDPIGYWGEGIVKASTPVIEPDQEFQEAIKILGLKPSDFKAVVISHGHLDHAGAIDNFLGTSVPIYFQKAEMAAIRKIVDAQIAGTAYILGDFQHLNELNIREIEGPFDIFGDKSIIVFPTPGHTPGHQSLYVKFSAGEAIIYCADALYTLENMDKFIAPGLATDIPGAMLNINWFKLQDLTGTRIVPSHDPEYWAKHAWAPSELVP
ncbi:MAG TPA: N-acyl homoserine lactonase family protein [Bacteroidales bacterium]|nr:N-acyl homoserine lactonase family protein [Bacteroidales bacterium]